MKVPHPPPTQCRTTAAGLPQLAHTACLLGCEPLAAPSTSSHVYLGCSTLMQEEEVLLASKGHHEGIPVPLQLSDPLRLQREDGETEAWQGGI